MSHKASPIIVSSSSEDNSDQDSEALEGEEDARRILPPNLHPSLCNLGDDVAVDEQHQAISLNAWPQEMEWGWALRQPMRLRREPLKMVRCIPPRRSYLSGGAVAPPGRRGARMSSLGTMSSTPLVAEGQIMKVAKTRRQPSRRRGSGPPGTSKCLIPYSRYSSAIGLLRQPFSDAGSMVVVRRRRRRLPLERR